MRKTLTFLSVCGLAGFGVAGGSAFAGGGKHHGGPGAFKMMDTDNDGKISATEHQAGAKKMFEMMDTSKDGKVTAEEMEAAQGPMGMGKGAGKMGKTMDTNMADKTVPPTADKPVTEKGPDSARMPHRGGGHMMTASETIKVVDTDGDGVLTAQEHEAGAKSMFEKMDADKDGNLTKSEMMAGHNKLMTKPAATK
ncbi:MAG TPA: EF-hand domain-containing protein [Polyangia bacterium]